MSANTNISNETNVAAVQLAQIVLDRLKRERYHRGNKYRLEKIGDHPLTFREVLVVGETESWNIDHDPVDIDDEDDVIEEVDFSELEVKKEDDED